MWDEAIGDRKENKSQRFDLCRHPAQIRHHNGKRAQPFNRVVIAQAIVVTNCQQIESVKLAGKKESSEDQATDDPTPGEAVEDMPMDMPMTTSVGGENAQSNDAAVVAWLAAVVVLVGGGAFYVLKVRKPKP